PDMNSLLRALGFFGFGAAVIAFALSFTDRDPAKPAPRTQTEDVAHVIAPVDTVSDFGAVMELERRDQAEAAARAAHTRAWRWRGLAALVLGGLAVGIARRRVRAQPPQLVA